MTDKQDEFCVYCQFYEHFNGVCFNGESENRAEFMDEFDSCDKFEKRGGRDEE